MNVTTVRAQLVRVLATMALAVLTAPSAARALACVVGTGAGTCTDSALTACLPGGGSFTGTVTFNCGGVATITVTSTKAISANTTIDGGSLITISGGGSVGVFAVSTGVTFTVQNLTIANGKSAPFGSGGGIFSDGGTVTVSNSTFSGNSASGGGGGIYSSDTLTVTNSTFSGNSSGASNNGGGILNNGGTVTVTNSTFSGNSASGGGAGGGGISNNFGTLTVTNSTFSGNGADSGGGIFNFLGTLLTVTNTILANSTSGGNCAGSVTDGGHNIDDGTSCGFTGTGCTLTTGTSFCNTDPVLDPTGLQNNGGPTQTIALCTGTGAPSAGCTQASPGINAGDESVCSTTTGTAPVDNLDQRGFARPGTGAANCSIGAFEASAAPDGTSCTGSGQCAGGECDPTTSQCCGQTADCSDGTSCASDSQCLSGTCAQGVCAEPPPTPPRRPLQAPALSPENWSGGLFLAVLASLLALAGWRRLARGGTGRFQ